MNKTKYIALTLGPIIKTLSLAKKTRELWGASYMFSYLMRGIVGELQKDPYKINGEFIMPSIENIGYQSKVGHPCYLTS